MLKNDLNISIRTFIRSKVYNSCYPVADCTYLPWLAVGMPVMRTLPISTGANASYTYRALSLQPSDVLRNQ